jgi:CIC family chloride channel protein
LALVIGALTGLAVVAFIVLTERMGMRLYPVGVAPWRRVLFPVVGSLGIGYLLYRYFPREGRITLRTVLGKFLHISNPRQRDPLGTRRAFGPGRRR